MNKIFLSCLIISCLTIALMSKAALRLPTNNPLQPMPTDTGANTSQNINTPGTETNKALQSESSQAEKAQDAQSPNPDVTPPIEVPSDSESVPTTSGGVYLIWLGVGLLGLIGAGFWIYIRFYRDE